MAGMQYQEKTAQENLQHPVMGAVFFAVKRDTVSFFVHGKIQHISIVNINFVYKERWIRICSL